MRYGSVLKTMSVLIWIILSGCPSNHSQPITIDEPALKEEITSKHLRTNYHLVQTDECKPIEVTDDLMKKVDNFMVIFDPSASMTESCPVQRQRNGIRKPACRKTWRPQDC